MTRRSMSIPWVAVVLTAILAASSATAQSTGYLQVTGPPGIEISLDGVLVGTTTQQMKGLLLSRLSPGQHKIRASKVGFLSQEGVLDVFPERVAHFVITALVPSATLVQEGVSSATGLARQVGNLTIQTLPIEAAVTISALNISRSQKTKDLWKLSDLPTGTYGIAVEALGTQLRTDLSVDPGRSHRLLFNFLERTVKDLTPEPLYRRIQTRSVDARFFMRKDGLVYDSRTDLEWLPAREMMSWADAQSWIKSLQQGFDEDVWRLPTLGELDGLWIDVDPIDGIRYYVTPFLKLAEPHYWSSSPRMTYWFGSKQGETLGPVTNPMVRFSTVAVRKRTGEGYPGDFPTEPPFQIPPGSRLQVPDLPPVLTNAGLIVRIQAAPRSVAEELYYSLIAAGMNGEYIENGFGLGGPKQVLFDRSVASGAAWLVENVTVLQGFLKKEGVGMTDRPIIIDLW